LIDLIIVCARIHRRQEQGDLKKEGGFLGAPPVAAGDSLFMATLAGAVLRIDPKTGEVRTTWEVGRPMRYPPTLEGGRVFVGTHDGRVVCIDTGNAKDTGWPQWGANAQRTGIAPAK
jgi:outer membrane protein assembly factor BamB